MEAEAQLGRERVTGCERGRAGIRIHYAPHGQAARGDVLKFVAGYQPAPLQRGIAIPILPKENGSSR